MNLVEYHKRAGREAAESVHVPASQSRTVTATHQYQTPAPQPAIHYKHQVGPIPEENTEPFIKPGKILAHTINAPFTTIPFIPAATPVLRKFDKATGQDLGFTYKASLSSQENAQGGKDLIYKIDYIGFGFMSNKFNLQVAPLAAKIEVGKEVYKGFGCNLSLLGSPIGFVHERLGVKATVTDCNNNSKSISVAEEISHQKSSSFKPISTATYGYFSEMKLRCAFLQNMYPPCKESKQPAPIWTNGKSSANVLDYPFRQYHWPMQSTAVCRRLNP